MAAFRRWPGWTDAGETQAARALRIKRWSAIVTAALSALFAAAILLHRLPPGLSSAQAVGILLGAWNTYLTSARSVWTWPVGIGCCLIFASVFGHAGLYGAMAMQMFYAASSVVGWRWWRRGGAGGGTVPVAHASVPLMAALAALVAASVPPLALLLHHARDAAPLLDALATMLCAAAQFLVMRRLVENWLFWIAADGVYVLINATHGMPFMGAMYLMHAVMCIYGLWRWRSALPTAWEAT